MARVLILSPGVYKSDRTISIPPDVTVIASLRSVVFAAPGTFDDDIEKLCGGTDVLQQTDTA